MGDGSLEALIASAGPPLRFLSQADDAQLARTQVPVRGWLERLDRVRNETGGSDITALLDALEASFRELARDDPAPRRDLAARALEILGRLETGGGAPSPGGAGAAPEERARASSGVGTASVGERIRNDGDREERDPTPAEVERFRRIASSPLTAVPGVGSARALELERFGLRTIEDLLYHLPFRYDDRRGRCVARELHAGESATTVLEIERVDERRIGRSGRAVLSALARDDTGRIELVWFNQIRWFRTRLKVGTRWVVHGRVERGFETALRIVHPELESHVEGDANPSGPAIVPVYEKPTTMPAATMRRIVHAAVSAHAGAVPDGTPAALRRRLRLPPLSEALARVHSPGPDADVPALDAVRSREHRAIVFDELFLVQLGLLLRKGQVAREPGISFGVRGDLVRRMIAALPFPLTGAQNRVIAEIEVDQRAPHPMHRLVQGDVGSGKTVVAVAAALRAIEAGWQAVIMAPTELLAEQHWETVRRVAGGLGVELWFLTGEATAGERRALLPSLAAGVPGLAVGTHALIQEEVRFGRLGLAVIDEQHRFGVMQRAALSRTGGTAAPDVLLMTATPIPRTLALSVYGDLDLSTIDELPPGRKPVTTRVFSAAQRTRAHEIVRREVLAGRQAYVVYPLIEESESSDLRDATSAAEEFASSIFPDLRVALVHGRMPAAERDAIMRAFKAGGHQILVSTTVIEVGIDVPNASVIVIEHAERFGLAQLHQLRGRVGRGADAAYCLLVADWAQSKEARERLRVMTETRDGLRIAEADLAIRGPGAMLGTRQAGLPDFRVANLLRDADVLREARSAAEEILSRDPLLSRPESAALARILDARWSGKLGLARVG